MQCLPVLVALETCTDPSVASKAFALHSLLHEKHSGLINTRLAESIDTVIKYQKRVLGDRAIMGHTTEPLSALLSRWYSLMREKRQWRNEFLKAFMRGLHVEPTASDYSQVRPQAHTACAGLNLQCFYRITSILPVSRLKI